jgi:membrane protein DedA with SNARE-associated domain
MHELVEFLLHHGYSVLAAWVFVEQVGLPLPSLPLMLAAGALSGSGRMNLFACLLSCLLACLFADGLWYQLGRRKGIKVLQWLCRISLEPDSCVRRTEGIFEKNGARSLLFAKFVPGLGAVATPLAGIFHMRPRRFVFFDSLGALLWVSTYLGMGYLFSSQIERIAQQASTLGGWLVVLLVAGLAAYISIKFVARQRFLREVRIGRISPLELKEKIDAGEELFIVDLRHSLDFEAQPELIPGAVHLDSKELSAKGESLPRDREIILYCT